MFRFLFRLLLFVVIVFTIIVFLRKPSNDRDWIPEMERRAEVNIETIHGEGVLVKIKNIRNVAHEGDAHGARFFADEFEVSRLERVWFLVEPSASRITTDRSFFIFDFENGKTLAFSAAARIEKSESYSPFRGLFREYELYYLFASEKDLIHQHLSRSKQPLYMYPVKASKEDVRSFFTTVALRASRVEVSPIFYNTIKDSNANIFIQHFKRARGDKLSLRKKIEYYLQPSDRSAFNLGLLDSEKTLAELREGVNIRNRAFGCKDDMSFSACLRSVSGEEVD